MKGKKRKIPHKKAEEEEKISTAIRENLCVGRSQHAHRAIFGVADEKRKKLNPSLLLEAQR
jgi:hypothetical protein